MATSAPIRRVQDASTKAAIDSLADDFFHLAESQLAKMQPEERESAIASIHATAESLRAEK